MRVLRNTDPKILALTAFDRFSEAVERFAGENGSVTVGLSGGTSLSGFYRELVESFSEIPESYRKKIRFVLLDERMVPQDDPESNFRLLSDTVFDPLRSRGLILSDQAVPVPVGSGEVADEYSRIVHSIDIGLFWVGPDGHVASLFPNHPALSVRGEGYVRVEGSPKPPPSRLSLSLDAVRNLPSAFAFFIGEAKREALERFLDDRTPVADCPAKALRNVGGLWVLTDLEERE